MSEAMTRLREMLERAEAEFPYLAAPDGTVAVGIEDLGEILHGLDAALVDFRAQRINARGFGERVLTVIEGEVA